MIDSGINLKVQYLCYPIDLNVLAEIHLHRHKTVIRACRGRLKNGSVKACPEEDSTKNGKGVGKVRHVKLIKESNEGLGISITGVGCVGCEIVIIDLFREENMEFLY